MRRASPLNARRLALVVGLALAVWAPAGGAQSTQAAAGCKPLYLTIDTGHMGVAPLIADVLARQQVRVTFFAANERTRTGGSSLDDDWAPWWR
ncbi:MAG: peptidase A8, partial [Lysobacteraceae bacterium]